jgi:hypothetical protein
MTACFVSPFSELGFTFDEIAAKMLAHFLAMTACFY